MDDATPPFSRPFTSGGGVAPYVFKPADPGSFLLWERLDRRGGVTAGAIRDYSITGKRPEQIGIVFPPPSQDPEIPSEYSGVDVENDEARLSFLAERNEEQMRKALRALDKVDAEHAQHPTSSRLALLEKNLVGVVGDFKAWFLEHCLPVPPTDRTDKRAEEIEEMRERLARVSLSLDEREQELAECRQAVAELEEQKSDLEEQKTVFLRRRERPSDDKLKEVMDKRRMKNGKANYSAMSRDFDADPKTVEKWVTQAKLLEYAKAARPLE